MAALATAADGSVWIGMTRSGPGLGLQQLQQGVWKPVATPGFDGSSLVVNALFMDRDKAMWIGTEGQGLYRIADGQVDRFLRADGLSGDSVTGFYEDREGNIWVATSEGIDCFRETRMVSFSVREGLSANQAGSVLAARDGTVWVGNQGALDAIRGRHVSSIRQNNGLPGVSVTALLEDQCRPPVGRHRQRTVGLRAGQIPPHHPSRRRSARRDHRDDRRSRGQHLGASRSGLLEGSCASRTSPFEKTSPCRGSRLAPRCAADPTEGIWLGLDSGDLGSVSAGPSGDVSFPAQWPGRRGASGRA